MKLSLNAHKFDMDGGYVRTEIFGSKGKTVIEVSSFEEAEKEISKFGNECRPCNIWISCMDARKPRGFDKWNSGATRFLFE